jgi:nucleoid-associated protein YgaU
VADGDTLTELAKQYLGSANRWTELYEYNRDVLTNPDLLPIGAELRIPTTPFRPSASGTPMTTQPATARPVSQAIDAVPSGAPAVEKSAAPSGAPSAKLRRLPPVLPEPTGHVLRVAPRTYVVQPGDTLNSVAAKLYGDGAREDLLRDANRKLVSSDQDLRPGTVLVIPLSDR